MKSKMCQYLLGRGVVFMLDEFLNTDSTSERMLSVDEDKYGIIRDSGFYNSQEEYEPTDYNQRNEDNNANYKNELVLGKPYNNILKKQENKQDNKVELPKINIGGYFILELCICSVLIWGVLFLHNDELGRTIVLKTKELLDAPMNINVIQNIIAVLTNGVKALIGV